MAALPIIRLAATSEQNCTITDDPLQATATLYVFLRSMPTKTEVDISMQGFVRRLHDGQHQPMAHRGNARMVNVLQSCVVQRVLRQAPTLSPAWCRRDDRWMDLLTSTSENSPLSPTHTEAPSDDVAEKVHDGEEDDEDDVLHAHVQTSTREVVGHQTWKTSHNDPFQAYMNVCPNMDASATHVAAPSTMISASPTRAQDVNGIDTTPDVRQGGNDVSPLRATTSQTSSTYAASIALSPAESLRSPSAKTHGAVEVSLSPDGVGEGYDDDGDDDDERRYATYMQRHQEEDAAPITGDARLEAILHHFREATTAPPTTHDEVVAEDLDQREEDFHVKALDQFADARAQWLLAERAIRAEVEEHADHSSLWSVSHSHHKAGLAMVHELGERLNVAENLFRLQRYEQETIQQAHVAILLEIEGLRSYMAQVEHGLEEAAHHPQSAKSLHVLQQLHHLVAQPIREEEVEEEEMMDASV